MRPIKNSGRSNSLSGPVTRDQKKQIVPSSLNSKNDDSLFGLYANEKDFKPGVVAFGEEPIPRLASQHSELSDAPSSFNKNLQAEAIQM